MNVATRRLVRERYDRRCGYCGVSEDDTGGELTIDHFVPVIAGGSDDASNLVYACFRCNLHKGILTPDASNESNERRLLHPLVDDLAKHIDADESSGLLIGRTTTGRFHIDALRLNRPVLVAHRKLSTLGELLATRFALLESENNSLRERITRSELYAASLEERLAMRQEEP